MQQWEKVEAGGKLTWLVHGDSCCCSLNLIIHDLRVVHALLDNVFPADLLKGRLQGIACVSIITIMNIDITASNCK